jgi:hypothetical protein
VTTRPLATAVHEAPAASSVLALAPCAPHVAKRRAVARVRIDDACGARWPHAGRLSGMPIESACGGAVGTAGAGALRDRDPRGMSRSRVTGRASSSDGAASAAVLPATHAPFGIARAGSSLCLSGIPGEGLCDEAQRTADPTSASPGMPPQPRGVTGRRVRVRSRTATSLLPTSSIAARTSTPMRLSHAAPGYLNPGTREGPRTEHARGRDRMHSEDIASLAGAEHPRRPESRTKSWALWATGASGATAALASIRVVGSGERPRR